MGCGKLFGSGFRAVGFADDPYGAGAQEEEYAGGNEHTYGEGCAVGGGGDAVEDETAAESSNYLGHCDGAVEEAQVGADVAARESIGEDGEGHGEHSGPGAAHEGVAHEEGILVVDEVYRNEAHGADEEAERIEELAAAYAAKDDCPEDGGEALDGEEDAVPVAGVLILRRGGVSERQIGRAHV